MVVPTCADILLVEDNRDELDAMAIVFRAEGFSVLVAQSVDAAIALVDGAHPPRLIITDLVMPIASGWQFLKYLREDPALRHVPIIVCTGAVVRGAPLAADAVLMKPVEPQILLAEARRLLAAGPPVRPGER